MGYGLLQKLILQDVVKCDMYMYIYIYMYNFSFSLFWRGSIFRRRDLLKIGANPICLDKHLNMQHFPKPLALSSHCGKSCGLNSKADLIQNFILKARVLRH